MGGIYNTVNFHLYHYAGIGQRSDSELQANNPVKYTDPTGRELDTVVKTVETTIDLGIKLAPLFEEPNPDNPMTKEEAIQNINNIQGLLNNMVGLAKKDTGTFAFTIVLEGLCTGIAFDTGLVDAFVDLNDSLKEKGLDIMKMKFSGSINLSSNANLNYTTQFEPSFNGGFNFNINFSGNLNVAIDNENSFTLGTLADITIPSKLMPSMQLSFSYKTRF
ncbi:hypothetical protein H0R92_10905 [Treponema sp. OMZ 840]|uniref:hypothetical protein n=1 Tax=Treponema sp. OMZ 840 TaxID=244313 RepID=UPI003D8ABBEA